MGLFDIGIRKEISSQKSKDEILSIIEKDIKDFSQETPKIEDGTLILNNFKSSILSYNLTINLEKSSKGYTLAIDGELQQFFVLILVGLIILSIIVTVGIGVIFIVAFAYLQKHFATKLINSLIEDIS
ncbi:MAG: hypothetical protein C0625_11035 [Arcobacter sp.]|nr:MAG: hypothetical protein C0625_11035 [Arcobacter sp.]